MMPCPFCGGNKIEPYQEFERAKWGRMTCAECGAMGPDVRTGYAGPEEWRDRATAEWDRRADERTAIADGRRQGIEEAAASHEHNGGNPVFRKMEADAIRALADKRP